jgi:peptidyl-prolyl cis-trans isomerase SurA
MSGKNLDRVHRQGAAGIVALVLFSLPAAPPAPGQEPEILDGIAAIVAEEIILISEIEEELFLASLRGRLDLADEGAVQKYRGEVLDALIEGKILLVKARAEGIQPVREEIDSAVSRMLEDIRARFPSDEAFQTQLELEGTTVEDLERGYRDKVEEQLAVRQLVDRSVRSRVSVDEREVQQYWDAHREEIPPVPAGLDLSHILIAFRSGTAVDSAAVRRAEIVRERLAAGEDFATLARVFSEGPAASKGGDLGWFAIDDLDPALAGALRGRALGELTDVVVSDRGAHILRVEGLRDDGQSMRLSQIVFLRDEDAARSAALARAEAIRRRLEAGEDFTQLARTESDDPQAAEGGGHLGLVPLESLPDEFRPGLEPLGPGELSTPLESPEGFSIFRVNAKEGERMPTYDEAHDRLFSFLEQEKAADIYREFLEKIRSEVYVEKRSPAEG